MSSQREIERKFVIPTMPPLQVYGDYRTVPCSIIEQHYKASEHDHEERVRKEGTHYTHTIKTGHGMVRAEDEQKISAEDFANLKRDSIASITKNRYRIRYGDWTLELDEYTGKLASLVILEIEFKTEEDAAAFILPDWAINAIEVTTNEDYKNKNLALYGIPSTHLCTIQ